MDDLGKFVWVQLSDDLLEFGIAFGGGLDQQRYFRCGFQFPLPLVTGLAGCKHIDAGGQLSADKRLCNGFSAALVWHIGQDQDGGIVF